MNNRTTFGLMTKLAKSVPTEIIAAKLVSEIKTYIESPSTTTASKVQMSMQMMEIGMARDTMSEKEFEDATETAQEMTEMHQELAKIKENFKESKDGE